MVSCWFSYHFSGRTLVESYNTERALRKIKRHSSVALDVSSSAARLEKKKTQSDVKNDGGNVDRMKLIDEGSVMECDATSSGKVQCNTKDGTSKNFIGGPSSWDPYSEGVNFDNLRASLASRGQSAASKQKDSGSETMSTEGKLEEPRQDSKSDSTGYTNPTVVQKHEGMTLKDAVKPKNTRKKRAASNQES